MVLMVGVIPFNDDATEKRSCPVFGSFVVDILEGFDEKIGMFKANVFDPKVINDEGELNRASFVRPQARYEI